MCQNIHLSLSSPKVAELRAKVLELLGQTKSGTQDPMQRHTCRHLRYCRSDPDCHAFRKAAILFGKPGKAGQSPELHSHARLIRFPFVHAACVLGLIGSTALKPYSVATLGLTTAWTPRQKGLHHLIGSIARASRTSFVAVSCEHYCFTSYTTVAEGAMVIEIFLSKSEQPEALWYSSTIAKAWVGQFRSSE